MRSAPFLKRLASHLLVAGAAIVLIRSALSGSPQLPKDVSPHAEALEFVLKTQGDVIRKAEDAQVLHRRAGDAAWWFDTKVRTWHVWRPFGPGVVDSTHSFLVGYFVGGDEVAAWDVDTARWRASRYESRGKRSPEVFGEWKQTGLDRDIHLLRDECWDEEQFPLLHFSPERSRQAASRIFDRIKFIGMSRADVVWMLGNPFTIGGWDEEMVEGADDPMVYRFIGEKSGDEYRIFMKDHRVVQVQRQGLPGARKP